MSDNLTPNPKCSNCKCYWKPTDDDIRPSGLYFKTCVKCRDNAKKYKCIHDKHKSQCKECGGGGICIHDKHKSRCRDCGGSGICIHDKHKSTCKECGGSGICIHNKQKSRCKECGGGSICIHNKRKSQCKDCGGSSFCIHDKQKSTCKDCKGSSICIHNKIKSTCKDCDLPRYLISIQRGNIYRCLKSSNLSKTKPSIEYLGCNAEYFIEFFKKKMDIWNITQSNIMTWENIHIDHIKPVSLFNLDDEDEFLSCCHYTNLQPLIGVDNLEKHNKWKDNDNEFWITNIKDNDDYNDIYIPI